MSAASIPGCGCMDKERRLFPRREVCIPVELTNCLGDVAQGTIVDLSEQGMRVAGDSRLARLNERLPGIPLELSLSFRVQGELIRCDARTAYLRRCSAERYETGLEFSWLDHFSRRYLQQEVTSGSEGESV